MFHSAGSFLPALLSCLVTTQKSFNARTQKFGKANPALLSKFASLRPGDFALNSDRMVTVKMHLLTLESGLFQGDNSLRMNEVSAMIITYEEIAKRAFEIWRNEGEIEGREQDHWLRAESELRKERSKQQKGKRSSSKDSSMMKTPRGENL